MGQAAATAADLSPPVPLTPGTFERALSFQGRERTYLIYIPPGIDTSTPIPPVLVFHGGLGNARNALRMTGFNRAADQAGFLVVYPNGSGRRPDVLLTWNGGDCRGYAVEQQVDDVGFVRALIAALDSEFDLDPRRIYATGMSNGAIMSYRLACQAADIFAAIGPVAATQNFDGCQPSEPVSIIHFHGTADRHTPYEGGMGPDSLAGVAFTSVEETIAFWVGRDACPSEPESERRGSILHARYSPCTSGTAVELYTIEGGGHAWPGSVRLRPGADEPTREISATDTMWTFFASHPKP